MGTHVYRSFAVKEARDSGWTAFGTRLDKDGVWKAHYERGDNPADVTALQLPNYFTHGEVSWIPGRTNDEDPRRIGVLVAKCGLDHLAQLGAVEVDRTYARVFLTPHGTDIPMLVEHESGHRWGIFTPKAEGVKPTAEEAPAKPAKAARTPKATAAPANPFGGTSGDREGVLPKDHAYKAPATAAPASPPVRSRSEGDSPVKRVWATADAMPGASRSEVVQACVAAGINKNTAGTQYFHWKRAKGAVA